MSTEGRVRRSYEEGTVGVTLGNTEYVKPMAEWLEILGEVQELEENDLERDRAEFLDYAAGLIKYWAELPEVDHATGRKHTVEGRISGCIFSLLVALDGGAGVGPYRVQRLLSDGETGKVLDYGPDIAGSLHELLGNHKKELEGETNASTN